MIRALWRSKHDPICAPVLFVAVVRVNNTMGQARRIFGTRECDTRQDATLVTREAP